MDMESLHYRKEVNAMNFYKLRALLHARKDVIIELKVKLNLISFRRKWRDLNKNNGTVAINVFPVEKVSVGNATYGGLKVLAFGNPDESLSIGSYCSIAESVTFVLGGEHGYRTLSTFPLWTHVLGHESNGYTPTKGPITVEDDVWIGYGATILSGVTIGKGAIVAAGSVVSKDVPPYAIWAGNKVIKKRFPDEVIALLTAADLSKLSGLSIEQQKFICEQAVDLKNAEKIVELLR